MKTYGFVGWLSLIGVALLPVPIEAKPRPSVTASFEAAADTAQVGAAVDVVLRINATADAPDVTAELLPSSLVQIVSGPVQWSGSLKAGDTVPIPFRVRFLGTGDYTLGARVMNRIGGRTETSGAVLYVTTTGTTAELSTTDHFTRRLSRAVTAGDRLALGVATPARPRAPLADPAARAVTGTVHGTVRWTDPEGNTHPVRGARVQILDGGQTGGLLMNTVTDGEGQYSASVNATTNQVTVLVYTVDGSFDPNTGLGGIVRVNPDGLPNNFHAMFVGPVALTADLTVDVTTPRTQRGTPGNPDTTPSTVTWRAFAVFDGMRTYWYQASALLGRSMPTAHVNYPSTRCPTSCFFPSSTPRQFFIFQEDAYDWDLLGHEFTHFLTQEFSFGTPASGRVIDTNPGGSHNFGTAIGQPPATGQPGRNRDQGMRLAWGEGVATAMSLLLQQAPLATVSPFPTNLLNHADGKYEDTEESSISVDAETPSPNQGFGSENSITGVLWDLFDTHQDAVGAANDSIGGLGVQTLWDAITAGLPCNPCDRIDRLWSSVLTFLGVVPGSVDPVIFEVAKTFVINNVAPRATAPADGSTVSATPPTFQWIANGDPSASHRNNHFVLVFSRDNFQSHLQALFPALGAAQYTPTQAEWNDLRQGGSPTAIYKWFVAGWSSDAGPGNPQIPESFPWFSNLMTFLP